MLAKGCDHRVMGEFFRNVFWQPHGEPAAHFWNAVLIQSGSGLFVTTNGTGEPISAGVLLTVRGVIECCFHDERRGGLSDGFDQGFTSRKKRVPALKGTVTSLVPLVVVMTREELIQLVAFRSGLS